MIWVDENSLNDLVCKVNSLQAQLYVANGYKTVLPDSLTYTINQGTHKLLQIRGYLFLNPAGKEVEVLFEVLPDRSVKISANTTLLNSTLIIF